MTHDLSRDAVERSFLFEEEQAKNITKQIGDCEKKLSELQKKREEILAQEVPTDKREEEERERNLQRTKEDRKNFQHALYRLFVLPRYGENDVVRIQRRKRDSDGEVIVGETYFDEGWQVATSPSQDSNIYFLTKGEDFTRLNVISVERSQESIPIKIGDRLPQRDGETDVIFEVWKVLKIKGENITLGLESERRRQNGKIVGDLCLSNSENTSTILKEEVERLLKEEMDRALKVE
ncbi:MAG TPA: hypothetical protein VJB99_02055 [Patescibacteria group bacterium]|nr:hypothetical protein [Patescibacteria group bacterium]